MDNDQIRQKLQNYFEIADERKIQAFYIMMENEINEANSEYSDTLKDSLDKQYGSFKNGSSSTVPAENSKKRIENILNKRNNQ